MEKVILFVIGALIGVTWLLCKLAAYLEPRK